MAKPQLLCPLCRSDLTDERVTAELGKPTRCDGCGAAHHDRCWKADPSGCKVCAGSGTGSRVDRARAGAPATIVFRPSRPRSRTWAALGCLGTLGAIGALVLVVYLANAPVAPRLAAPVVDHVSLIRNCNLRGAPTTQSESLRVIPEGTAVPQYAVDEGWVKTTYDNVWGWVGPACW